MFEPFTPSLPQRDPCIMQGGSLLFTEPEVTVTPVIYSSVLSFLRREQALKASPAGCFSRCGSAYSACCGTALICHTAECVTLKGGQMVLKPTTKQILQGATPVKTHTHAHAQTYTFAYTQTHTHTSMRTHTHKHIAIFI